MLEFGRSFDQSNPPPHTVYQKEVIRVVKLSPLGTELAIAIAIEKTKIWRFLLQAILVYFGSSNIVVLELCLKAVELKFCRILVSAARDLHPLSHLFESCFSAAFHYQIHAIWHHTRFQIRLLVNLSMCPETLQFSVIILGLCVCSCSCIPFQMQNIARRAIRTIISIRTILNALQL